VKEGFAFQIQQVSFDYFFVSVLFTYLIFRRSEPSDKKMKSKDCQPEAQVIKRLFKGYQSGKKQYEKRGEGLTLCEHSFRFQEARK